MRGSAAVPQSKSVAIAMGRAMSDVIGHPPGTSFCGCRRTAVCAQAGKSFQSSCHQSTIAASTLGSCRPKDWIGHWRLRGAIANGARCAAPLPWLLEIDKNTATIPGLLKRCSPFDRVVAMRFRSVYLAGSIACMVLLVPSICGTAFAQGSAESLWPTTGWQTSAPEEQGMETAALA